MLTLPDGSYKEWREEEVGFWLLAAVPSRFECGVHPQFVLIGCGNIVHDAALLELDPLQKSEAGTIVGSSRLERAIAGGVPCMECRTVGSTIIAARSCCAELPRLWGWRVLFPKRP
jgi:hypothetical protein